MSSERILIGKIIGPRGVKGEVKVAPLTFSLKRFKEIKEVLIELHGESKVLQIEYSKLQNNIVILKFKGLSSISEVESLKGAKLKISQQESPSLPEDTYYYYQIIGMEVFTENNREYIGKIKEILETGANDVYIVKHKDKEYLIPAVKEFIKKIDIEKKEMVIKPIKGLL